MAHPAAALPGGLLLAHPAVALPGGLMMALPFVALPGGLLMALRPLRYAIELGVVALPVAALNPEPQEACLA
jgi:hypothetical protein